MWPMVLLFVSMYYDNRIRGGLLILVHLNIMLKFKLLYSRRCQHTSDLKRRRTLCSLKKTSANIIAISLNKPNAKFKTR